MINLLTDDSSDFVRIENLTDKNLPSNFSAAIPEYEEYILKTALQLQQKYITKTFLLIDNESSQTIAYISLITDSVSFTPEEKESSDLSNIIYRTFPALKIAQLAVSKDFCKKYSKVGSYMIEFAESVMHNLNKEFVACRFLTVDADIENNPTVDTFYEKNGFKKMTDKKYIKKTKIACMFKDILR